MYVMARYVRQVASRFTVHVDLRTEQDTSSSQTVGVSRLQWMIYISVYGIALRAVVCERPFACQTASCRIQGPRRPTTVIPRLCVCVCVWEDG